MASVMGLSLPVGSLGSVSESLLESDCSPEFPWELSGINVALLGSKKALILSQRWKLSRSRLRLPIGGSPGVGQKLRPRSSNDRE